MESAGGDKRICRSRPLSAQSSNNLHLIDRKLDFLVSELGRYQISITGVQETKWFGNDIWRACGYTMLHSGRPLPDESEQATRNEGVGILLDKQATDA